MYCSVSGTIEPCNFHCDKSQCFILYQRNGESLRSESTAFSRRNCFGGLVTYAGECLDGNPRKGHSRSGA